MENDFRQRWATPFLLLLGILVLVLLVLFSVSRVLLAVPEMVATFTALAIAGYVLLIGGLIGKYRRVSGRALTGGLVVGLVALATAGVVAASAGIRDLHPEEEVAPDDEEAVGEIPADAHVWTAVNLSFEDSPQTIPAGEVTIALDNRGNLPHDVTIEGVGTVVEAGGGEQAWETVTLEPGEYYYYCDVPGHEPQMNGTILVE
jgi:plastocyanin